MADIASIVTFLAQAVPAADATVASSGIASYGTIGAGLFVVGAGLAAAGAGVGIGILVAAALEGSARQPEQANALKGTMILGIAFIEALALIAIILGFVTVLIAK